LRSKRIYLLVFVHLAIFALSYEMAYWLRFDGDVPLAERGVFWKTLPWIIAIKLTAFYCFGSLHGWWRYVTFADLAELLRVSTISTLAIAFVDHFLAVRYRIPRSVLLLDWGATMLLVGGGRSVWRLSREHLWPTLWRDSRRPALMIGADRGGDVLASSSVELSNRRLSRQEPFLPWHAARRDSIRGQSGRRGRAGRPI
jgi:FlaA1/EpsC-like NDP-sugar epimerase